MDSSGGAGRLTFALNVTLDGCCDHREMVADGEMLDHFTQLIGNAGAMLYGRTTYELMDAWPAVTRDEKAPRAMREWACTLGLFQGLQPSRHVDLVSTTRLESGIVAMHYRRKQG